MSLLSSAAVTIASLQLEANNLPQQPAANDLFYVYDNRGALIGETTRAHLDEYEQHRRETRIQSQIMLDTLVGIGIFLAIRKMSRSKQ